MSKMTVSEFARLGGKARAAKLSPRRRREIAMQGVAARHSIKADVTKKGGYTRRDLDTPLRKHFEALGKDGKAQFLFEVCVQATYSSGDRKTLLRKL